MVTQNIERRVEKLEEHLSRSNKPETVEEMFKSMENGKYGPVSAMSIVAAILSSGGSGEHLRGKGLPDELIDDFVKALNKPNTSDSEKECGVN